MSDQKVKQISGYPDPLAPFEEKQQKEYGLQYFKYIGDQWFNGGIIGDGCSYYERKNWVRERRLYARGKQGEQRYKQHLAREEDDLSFLNLDWRPTNYAGKFVRVVANGTNEDNYSINVQALDRLAGAERDKTRKELVKKLRSKELLQEAKDLLGVDVMPGGYMPEDEEDINMFMNIKHRPKCEISEEILINYVFKTNDWHQIKEQVDEDLTTAGIGVAKVVTDKYNGLQLEYIDPENFVHSYSKDKYFKDLRYAGHVESMTIGDIQRNGNFTEIQLREIAKQYSSVNKVNSYNMDGKPLDAILDMRVDVLHGAFQTTKTMVFKKRKTKHGDIYSVRDESYNPKQRSDYGRVDKTYNTWFEGSWIIGTNHIYDYKECENMVTDEMDNAKCDYIVRASDMYENELNSFVAEIEPILDQMHYTLLKLQHLTAEIRPNGAEIDISMLAELEGKMKGQKMTWQEILAMFQTKGIVFTNRADLGELGVKEGSAVSQTANGVPPNLPHLLEVLRDQYQRVRDITGINPFRDGSQDERALVGVQQLAFLQSNVATAHIVNASLDITKMVAERISARITDVFQSSRLSDLYTRAVGQQNMDVVEALKDRSLHEFGFHIQLKPTEQQIAELNEDLMIALKEGTIAVDDKQEVKDLAQINIKMAKEYLKYARNKRLKEMREEEMLRHREKSKNDIRANQMAQQAKVQAQQQMAQMNVWEYKQKKKIDVMTKQQLNEVDTPVRELDHMVALEKERIRANAQKEKTEYVEKEKLKRQNKNNQDHSKMIKQREQNSDPIDFADESDESFADILQSLNMN